MLQKLTIALILGISGASSLSADASDEAMALVNEATAHGECSSYIGFLYDDYTVAGFTGEKAAMEAKYNHLDNAANAAKNFVELASRNDIDGTRMIYKKAGKTCMGDTCFPSAELIAAMFTFGGVQKGQKEVSQKEIACPDGVWLPCFGAEPVGNRWVKAKNLYAEKNCRLLLR